MLEGEAPTDVRAQIEPVVGPALPQELGDGVQCHPRRHVA